MVNTEGEKSGLIKVDEATEVTDYILPEEHTSNFPGLPVNLDNQNEIPFEKSENDGYEEIAYIVESGYMTGVDNDGENILVTGINSDNKEQNTYEDDIDDHQVLRWGDALRDEEKIADEEENIADEDETSEDDDDYEVREEEEASEDDDNDDEDEDNEEKSTEVAKENEMEAKVRDDGTEAKKHDGDKVEAGLKDGKTPNKRIIKKKEPVGESKKLESGHKTKSSMVKKGKKKRAESMGMIFMCTSKTKNDCFQYKVLGLPESKKDIVKKIYSGMRLFLYDLDLKLMYGIYKAVGRGGYNIEPRAFKSQFPSQVRFTVLNNCLPLPEEKFKKVIKENYFTKTKFDCQLKSEQVKKLCKVFIESSRGNLSKKPRQSRKSEKSQAVRQVISKRRRVVDGRQEEFRYPERPRKISRHQPLPAPLPPIAPLYAYERPSDRRVHQYNPYRVRGDPSPVTRRELYRDGDDPYLERDYRSYRGGRNSYVKRHDPDSYVEHGDLYRDRQDTYPRRHDPYVDRRVSYLERRDPYIDGQSVYLERRDPYSEPYGVGSYRRDPLFDRRNAYREDEGGREGVLERGDVRVFDFDTRYRSDVGSRDSYVLNQGRPMYGDSITPREYPYRGVGLAREYRL